MAREPIEPHLRVEESHPDLGHVLLRGSPLTAQKFAEHARRTARAHTYLGEPCLGISVELSRDTAGTVRLLQGRRLSTRRQVARIPVENVLQTGFVLLPIFAAPHYTVVLGRAPSATVETLTALAARDVIGNPYYQGRKEV